MRTSLDGYLRACLSSPAPLPADGRSAAYLHALLGGSRSIDGSPLVGVDVGCRPLGCDLGHLVPEQCEQMSKIAEEQFTPCVSGVKPALPRRSRRTPSVSAAVSLPSGTCELSGGPDSGPSTNALSANHPYPIGRAWTFHSSFTNITACWPIRPASVPAASNNGCTAERSGNEESQQSRRGGDRRRLPAPAAVGGDANLCDAGGPYSPGSTSRAGAGRTLWW